MMTTRAIDRRRTLRRTRTEDHGIVAARVRPGHPLSLVDLSGGGALVETARRLLPGTSVDVYLEAQHRRATLRARVLRCAIVRFDATSVCYRAAVAFDRPLPWFVEDESAGYLVPDGETRPGQPARVDPTPQLV